jgi:hypothetical protein
MVLLNEPLEYREGRSVSPALSLSSRSLQTRIHGVRPVCHRLSLQRRMMGVSSSVTEAPIHALRIDNRSYGRLPGCGHRFYPSDKCVCPRKAHLRAMGVTSSGPRHSVKTQLGGRHSNFRAIVILLVFYCQGQSAYAPASFRVYLSALHSIAHLLAKLFW